MVFVTFASDNVRRRVKFFAEASELFTHVVFHLVVVRKMTSSESILQRAKNWKSGSAKSGLWGGFTYLFGRTLPICCFNFCNVCTYRSELIVAPVFKKCTDEIPSPSLKTLAVALPAEGFYLFSLVLNGK